MLHFHISSQNGSIMHSKMQYPLYGSLSC